MGYFFPLGFCSDVMLLCASELIILAMDCDISASASRRVCSHCREIPEKGENKLLREIFFSACEIIEKEFGK